MKMLFKMSIICLYAIVSDILVANAADKAVIGAAKEQCTYGAVDPNRHGDGLGSTCAMQVRGTDGQMRDIEISYDDFAKTQTQECKNNIAVKEENGIFYTTCSLVCTEKRGIPIAN